MAKKLASVKQVVLFGTGNIGDEAWRQLLADGYSVVGVVRSKKMTVLQPSVLKGPPVMRESKISNPGDGAAVFAGVRTFCGDINLIVSAIPGGDGVFERDLMDACLPLGIPFVTAAKVALARHFGHFEPHLRKIGRNATVGGGTMMLDYLRKHLRVDDGQDSIVHLVINGTLSYAMTNRWHGRTMPAILRECVYLKLAEPIPGGGIPEGVSLFNGEIDDQLWKLLIILNDIYRPRIGRYVSADEITKTPLDLQSYQRYTAPGTRRKFVVRITTSRTEPEIPEGMPGSIFANIDDKVYVCGGFYDVPHGSAHSRWIPDIGPGNAVHIEQGGNVSQTTGDGAGPLATCDSIMHDVRLLCPL